MNLTVSCRSGPQSRDSEQVVGGGDQIGVHLHSFAATVASFAQTADGLHPAEGLLDSFAYPLADRIIRMMGGPCAEGGASGSRLILRHVRSDVERATAR